LILFSRKSREFGWLSLEQYDIFYKYGILPDERFLKVNRKGITMTIKFTGFNYKNELDRICNPDFVIEDGEEYVFDDKKYIKNCLIGVSGEFCGRYVDHGRRIFESKYGKSFLVNEEKMKNFPVEEKEFLTIAFKKYLSKKLTNQLAMSKNINPFPPNEYILKNMEFPLSAIVSALGLGEEKEDYKKPRLNWDPFVFDSQGKKQFYQRTLVWTLRDNQNLMESIYQEIDCGKIIIKKNEVNLVLKSQDMAFNDIVDGKQRMNALRGFINNEFPDLQGNYYSDFSTIARRDFQNRKPFAYAEISDTATDQQVIKQFLKVNFTGVPQSIEHIEFVKSLQKGF
jgi:hypothetical protein